MPKPKRLAITISGAVSLGSYEAGVLYEVIKAIGEHNLHPDTLANESQRIEIDVLTGASAGGMTAAIAAQVFLGGTSRMTSATDNAFYLPWVKQIDLGKLLAGTAKDDPPAFSILASSVVEDIANKNILDNVPAGPRHPAARSKGEIYLGLAMSNLEGIDYSKATHGVGANKFTYTRFQDEFTWKLDQSTAAPWKAIRGAALGCGAFPFAFRARVLDRAATDYPKADPSNFPQSPRQLTYLDGGIFQNEPLGLAKNFVDEIDGHADTDSRFYLFVAPGQKSGAAAVPGAALGNQLTMLKAAKGLAKAIFWQARFQDWVMANHMNAKIGLLNQRAAALGEMLLANPALAAMMQQPLELLLAPFYPPVPGAPAPAPGAPAPWAADLARLRKLFSALPNPASATVDYSALLGPVASDVWLKSILLLEKAAGLEDKEEMEIYTITSEDDELGGDPLFAFAGFLDEEIRQYDYSVGRKKAREWLRNPQGGLFPIRATLAGPEPVLDPKLASWKIGQFNRQKREGLRDKIQDRLDLVLKEAGVSWLVRKAIEGFFINGKVDTLLGLD